MHLLRGVARGRLALTPRLGALQRHDDAGALFLRRASHRPDAMPRMQRRHEWSAVKAQRVWPRWRQHTAL